VTKWAFQAGKAAAQAVISGVWSLITTANFGAAGVVTTASGFTVAGVRALRKALSQAHVPTDNRSLIVDSNYYDNLLSDSTNVLANLNFGPSAIKDGAINRLGGFDIFESQLIPSSGSTSDGNNMFGFAAHQSAIAVAIRALQPQAPSEYLETKVMTDDASGASIGFRRHYNPGTGIHYLNAEVLFGYAVGITAGLKRIISTT
jgi:hypothetical protein